MPRSGRLADRANLADQEWVGTSLSPGVPILVRSGRAAY
jgi:hypothetical protein